MKINLAAAVPSGTYAAVTSGGISSSVTLGRCTRGTFSSASSNSRFFMICETLLLTNCTIKFYSFSTEGSSVSVIVVLSSFLTVCSMEIVIPGVLFN